MVCNAADAASNSSSFSWRWRRRGCLAGTVFASARSTGKTSPPSRAATSSSMSASSSELVPSGGRGLDSRNGVGDAATGGGDSAPVGRVVHAVRSPALCEAHSTKVFARSRARLASLSACALALRSMWASRCHSRRASPARTRLRRRRRRRFVQEKVPRTCESARCESPSTRSLVAPWWSALSTPSSMAMYSAELLVSLPGMKYEHVHTTAPPGSNSAAPAPPGPGLRRHAPSKRRTHATGAMLGVTAVAGAAGGATGGGGTGAVLRGSGVGAAVAAVVVA